MVSAYSIVSAVLFFNLGMLALHLMQRNKEYMVHYTVSTFMFLALLSVLRLLLPLDFKSAYVISSYRFLPWVIGLLDIKLFGSPLTVGRLLLLIWGAGTAYCAARFVYIELRATRARKHYVSFSTKQIEAMTRTLGTNLRVKLSPNVREPYTVGIIRPVIYLPIIDYTDEELRLVLEHELCHIRSHDNLKKLFFISIDILFWWNPLSHVFSSEIEMLNEMSCDRKITAELDSDGLKKYLDVMLSVTKKLNGGESREEAMLVSSFAMEQSLPNRCEVMLRRKERKPQSAQRLMCSVFLTLFILSFFIILQPTYPDPVIENKIIISSETAYILNDNNKFILIWNGQAVEELPPELLREKPYNELEVIQKN